MTGLWIFVKKWLWWLNKIFKDLYIWINEKLFFTQFLEPYVTYLTWQNYPPALVWICWFINHPSLWGIFPLFNFFHSRHKSKILDNFRRKQNEALHWFINHPLFWLSWVQLNFDEIFWFLFLVPRVPSKGLQNESLASAEAYSIVSSSYPFYS